MATTDARARVDEFLDALTEDELARLLRKLRGFTIQGPVTHQQYMDLFVPPQPERPRSPEELQRLEDHAAAIAARDAAQQRWQDALARLMTAERARGPERPDGSRGRTQEQEAEVQRLAEEVDELRHLFDAACENEVAARPHQPAKRRARQVKYAPGGVIVKPDGAAV